ncbi:MAG: polyprenyl synthetase family protein [Marinilabiliaceae bacterium]|nr:polyprenyl synthetase family protein [Marinilabiliaceae bacterium]
MSFISEFQSITENQINKLNLIKTPKGLYEPIEYILQLGGKRIRPALCMAACYYFSGNYEPSIEAALGIEMFHNFTLLHDDIMDHSSIRRGKPTVHKKWNENTAILSGDAMMVKACQLMLNVPSEVMKEIQSVFYQTSLEVCEGQQLDMDFENRQDVEIEEYIEMIRLKTAILLAASLKIGAIIGGAKKEDAQNLYKYGESIGLAFQLQDDYLDVYGKTSIFGKKVGQDIIANKKTFLLLSCIKNANKEQLKELRYWIDASSINPDEKVKAITKIYSDLKIDEKSKELMNDYYQKSIIALNKVNIKPEYKEELKRFAMNLMNRFN